MGFGKHVWWKDNKHEFGESVSVDYRQILVEELESRKYFDQSYSLRSFAKEIGMTPSHLSDVLKSKHGISKKKANNIATILGFEEDKKALFCDQVESCHGRSKVSRESAHKRLQLKLESAKSIKIKEDVFALVKDWYHFAILEIFECNPKVDVPEICSRLELPLIHVEGAILRLQRLSLLKKEAGKFVPATSIHTSHDISSEAIKKSHMLLLDKAKKSLYSQPVAARDFTSTIFSIPASRVQEAKSYIAEFNKNFAKEFGSKSKKDNTIYNLSTTLFSLESHRYENN